jgi:hypothetical protein
MTRTMVNAHTICTVGAPRGRLSFQVQTLSIQCCRKAWPLRTQRCLSIFGCGVSEGDGTLSSRVEIGLNKHRQGHPHSSRLSTLFILFHSSIHSLSLSFILSFIHAFILIPPLAFSPSPSCIGTTHTAKTSIRRDQERDGYNKHLEQTQGLARSPPHFLHRLSPHSLSSPSL